MNSGNFILLALSFWITPLISSGQNDSVLKNGTLTGSSRSIYTGEDYWGIVKMSVSDGRITAVNFIIRDSALHEDFNDSYARHFEGNKVYIRQTHENAKGVRRYPGILMKKQDIRKVDVISGATWSYNIFKAAVDDALNDSGNRK